MSERIGVSPHEIAPSPLPSFSSEVSHHGNFAIEYGSIPSPEQRFFTETAMHTAGHELNHALVALDHGIMPVALSIVPDGPSLGRTIFTGKIDTETFQIIAAGGAVTTAYGSASGFGSENHYGSDFYHIHKLKQEQNGIDVQEAVERAERSISRVPVDVRRKASEIIASMKNISGEMIPHIISIAEREVQNGISLVAPKMFESVNEIKTSKAYHDAQTSGEQTVIDIDADGIAHAVVLSNEKNACSMCRGLDGHRISCAFYQTKETEQKTSTDMVPGVDYTLQNPHIPSD